MASPAQKRAPVQVIENFGPSMPLPPRRPASRPPQANGARLPYLSDWSLGAMAAGVFAWFLVSNCASPLWKVINEITNEEFKALLKTILVPLTNTVITSFAWIDTPAWLEVGLVVFVVSLALGTLLHPIDAAILAAGIFWAMKQRGTAKRAAIIAGTIIVVIFLIVGTKPTQLFVAPVFNTTACWA